MTLPQQRTSCFSMGDHNPAHVTRKVVRGENKIESINTPHMDRSVEDPVIFNSSTT